MKSRRGCAKGLLAALAVMMSHPAYAAGGILPYQDEVAVAAGAEIYAESCAACHGANLEGEPDWRSPKPSGRMPAPPHDETGHTWHHRDELLFQITKFGTEAVVGGTYESDMVGFGDVLSDAEILAVLAYIKSTWPGRVIEMHNRVNAQ